MSRAAVAGEPETGIHFALKGAPSKLPAWAGVVQMTKATSSALLKVAARTTPASPSKSPHKQAGF
jgi:hypothetical protein